MHSLQRGFFCSDETLRYPYHECTITVPMLLVCMLLLPMLFLCTVEIMRICKNFRIRKYLRNLWRSSSTFSFGFIATYLTTELAKNVIGRLRPHFYTACQPRLFNGTTCDTERVVYVERYQCSNRNLTSFQIRELYVSFPSAHAALSFYAMLFLNFYLHAIWRGRGTAKILRHILQFVFLLIAWFISLSRVADHWHHWSDVLAGAIMGVLFAILTAFYVAEMLPHTIKYKRRRQEGMIGGSSGGGGIGMGIGIGMGAIDGRATGCLQGPLQQQQHQRQQQQRQPDDVFEECDYKLQAVLST